MDPRVPPPIAPAASGAAAWRPRGLDCVGLAAAAGALWFAGTPGLDLWPLAWVAMVPTLFVVERATTTGRAFLCAWLTGLVANLGGFYWIAALLRRFVDLSWAPALGLLVLLCAYQGLVFALTGAVVRAVRRRSALPMALVAPLAMVSFELALPMVFPFNVAITQAWQHHVIQVADLTGPLGVTALLLMVNGAVYDLLVAGRGRRRSAFVALGVLMAALGYGHLRIAQVERARAAAPALDVGLVQPNLGFDEKGGDRLLHAPEQLRALREQSARLEALGADLLVWPELAFPYPLPHDLEEDRPEPAPERVRSGFSLPLVFGVSTWVEERPGRRNYNNNSALLLEPDGRVAGRFDKVHLMLGSEYLPGRDTFSFIAEMTAANASPVEPGDTVATLPLRTADGRVWRLGPSICLEDTLPGFGRRLSALHPHLLVNLTNDAWFGDTVEPWEHLGLSVFRAVETRADFVRCANSGVCAFVDAAGRVYAQTYAVDPALDPRPADGLVAEVRLLEGGHTPYAAVGDLFGYLCAAATFYLWILAPWMGARSRGRRRAS